MGIDYDSKLIVGWEVDRTKATDYLLKYDVGSCYEDEKQCFCGPKYCWKNRAALPLPLQFTFVEASPYFDSDLDDRGVYLTLEGSNAAPSVGAFRALLDAADWNLARTIAVKLGAEDAEPSVFSVAHVW